MEDRAPVVSQSQPSSHQANADQLSTDPYLEQTGHHHPHEGRGAWVLTAYGISGLALFGVLAYFFSDFIAR
jgi:hypothetical protein